MTNRSQVNLYNTQIGFDFPFINYIKTGQTWADTGSTIASPALLSTDGYPNGASSPQVSTRFFIETTAEYSGNWVLRWTGTVAASGFSFTGGYSNVSGALTGTNGNCVFTLSEASSPFRFVDFTIPAASNLTEVAFMRADEESRWLAGEIFNTKFLTVLASGGEKVLRFMDWGLANLSMETQWSDRKPVTYAYYASPELRASLFGGTTTNTRNAYSLSAPPGWGGLVDKARAIFYFNATQPTQDLTAAASGTGSKVRLTMASTASFATNDPVSISNTTGIDGEYLITVIDGTHVELQGSTFSGGMVASAGLTSVMIMRYTLSVGGTTAKFLYGPGGGPPYYPTQIPDAGVIGFAVYDSDLNCWCRYGGSVQMGGQVGLLNAVPPEIMIALANKLNMHPWFCLPYFSLDPVSNYASSLAALCISTLNAGLIPRFECANEVWNGVFNATDYSKRKGNALWGTPILNFDWDNWYGKVVSTAGQAISTAYGADRTKYYMLCAFATFVGTPSDQTERLNSDLYVSVNGGSAASNWATHICIANYFNSYYYAGAQESTWADEYASATTLRKAELVALYLAGNDLSSPDRATLPVVRTRAALFITQFPTYSGKMLFYEGGYSPDYGAGATANQDAFRVASKSGPLLVTQIQTNYNDMVAVGGVEPSCYAFSNNTAFGVWDPDIYASPTPPQWTGIIAWNASVSLPAAVTRFRFRLHG